MTESTRVVRPTPGRGLIRTGVALFCLGLVFVLSVVLPFAGGEHDRALWLNLGCLLAPLGAALALGGAVRGGRARQRAAVRAIRQR